MTPITENFREDLRYEYPGLTADSFLVDIGGYHGRWVKTMAEKYRCRIVVFEPIFWKECAAALEGVPNVTLFPCAAGVADGMVSMGVQGDMTGKFNGNKSVIVPVVNYVEWRSKRYPPSVPELKTPEITDCIKINCEGMEYELLEAMIATGEVKRCRNIQVQFHPIFADAEERYQKIRVELLKTHWLTYDFHWVWENWKLR